MTMTPPILGAPAICALAADLYRRGWLPGTSGNISTRQLGSDQQFLITASGRDKGQLDIADVVAAQVSDGARCGDGPAPSAEASIHAAIYRNTAARAVIHVHAPFSTAITCRTGDRQQLTINLAPYELAKGLGVRDIKPAPVLTNWPEVPRIAEDASRYLQSAGPLHLPLLFIGFHGVTAWGDNLEQARNRLECVESIAQLMVLTDQSSGSCPHHELGGMSRW